MKVTLLVACREQPRSAAYCAFLARVAGDTIAARATTFDDLVPMSPDEPPDVILIEHPVAEEERLWVVLRHLALVRPASRVLMLCELCTEALVASFIANGVSGSVAASCDASLLAKAVMGVHRGESWFARAAMLQALRRQLATHHGQQAAADEDSPLTAREREILSLIGVGLSNKEIGRHLLISDQTVKTHLHHIYVKLNRSGRYKAFAAKTGAFPGASWTVDGNGARR